MGLDLPEYEFCEDESFVRAKEDLGWADEELEEHLLAVQMAVGFQPLTEPWSVPLLKNPGIRVAVSDSTPSDPRAIRVIYLVDGRVIHFMHVQER